MLDSRIGFMESRLELAGGSRELGGRAMEQAIGQGATDALVEEDKHEGDPTALVGEAVSIAAAVTLQ